MIHRRESRPSWRPFELPTFQLNKRMVYGTQFSYTQMVDVTRLYVCHLNKK